MQYYIFYKPYGYLSQFTDADGNQGLGRLLKVASDVYAVGRLDLESEGLLLLTNDKKLNAQLLEPHRQHRRTYLVQVDGVITPEAAQAMERGFDINVNGKVYQTLPAEVRILEQAPNIPERIPPVRFRKNIPTSWVEISLKEGKNHQVRKMTAKVGFPTLRLIRIAIEDLRLEKMNPGDLLEIPGHILKQKCKLTPQ